MAGGTAVTGRIIKRKRTCIKSAKIILKNTFLTYSYDIIGTKLKSQEDITNE